MKLETFAASDRSTLFTLYGNLNSEVFVSIMSITEINKVNIEKYEKWIFARLLQSSGLLETEVGCFLIRPSCTAFISIPMSSRKDHK